MTQLTIGRRYLLIGYLDIIERATPNARVAHERAQKITALRLALQVDFDLPDGYELEVKRLIRELYGYGSKGYETV